MIRLKLSGGGSSPARELNQGVTRLGRGDDNDVRVEDASVSWHHCELELGEEALVVRDKGSRNGTFVDGRRVAEAELFSGQVLRLGDVESVIEQAPVRVTVPEIQREQRPQSVQMEDGRESCTNHPSVRASWRCTNCGKAVCHTCVHELHIKGMKSHKLCPLCSHHCEMISWDDGQAKKKSLWGVIKGVFTK